MPPLSIEVDQPYQPYYQPPRRSGPLILASWIIILLIVMGIGALVAIGQYMMPRETRISGAELLSINMMAKSLVGFQLSGDNALTQIDTLKTGPIEQRLAHVFLINELSGAEKAAQQLDLVDQAVLAEVKSIEDADETSAFPTDSQKELQQLTRSIISSYQAGNFDTQNITEEERELLEEKLGWVGKLALVTSQSPDIQSRQSIMDQGKYVARVFIFIGIVFFLALAAGVLAITGLVALAGSGKLQPAFQDRTRHGHVYIETFALWLILFMGLQFVFSTFAVLTGKPSLILPLSPLMFFGSLLALMWPIMRGLSWSMVCSDIGLELRNPIVEMCAGGISYISLTIPLLLGLVATAILGGLINLTSTPGEFESTAPAGHPITEEITAGGPMMYVFIVISACVAAPIVEEIMFRGVLYRYLRDATGELPARWMSVIASAFLGGLIFATVHPQGIVAIPMLTLLAMGFAMAREWRNSLIAPMTMHAIHNGLITGFLLFVLV